MLLYPTFCQLFKADEFFRLNFVESAEEGKKWGTGSDSDKVLMKLQLSDKTVGVQLCQLHLLQCTMSQTVH